MDFIAAVIIAIGAYVTWRGIAKPRQVTLIGIGIFVILVGVGTASGTSVLSSAISGSEIPTTPVKPHKVSHPLPKGVSTHAEVIEAGMEQSMMSYESTIASGFDRDMDDEDAIQVMENPKTKRYVFNYTFKGKVIPVYAIYARIKGEKFKVYLIPVKHNKIESILTKADVADKQINADTYYGYSYNDLDEMDVDDPFASGDHPEPKVDGDYFVYYR